MPPGLKDVAARAGVSIKTASNVVNGYVHVAPATRARVQAAIDALGYVPNSAARRLRGGRSGVVALAVPELRSPYFAELAGQVVAAAEPRGWTVLIDQTGGRGDREHDIVAGLRRHAIDGLILSPVEIPAGDVILRHGVPAVLLGERIKDERADHVAIDAAAAAAAATRHLLRLGRRRIAAIGAPDRPSAVAPGLRLAGYRTALAEAGIAPDPRMEIPADGLGRPDGAAAMAWLLDSGVRPDAAFCFTDLLALGAIRALLERGVAVPADIAVIGIGGIEEGRFSTPSLSTVDPDLERTAQLAVDLLAERLGGTGGPATAAPPRQICVEHRLIARESTLGRPAP
ncbi:LacI family DNA-binding transcriptional regulator [Actinoplanes sp. CA-030573]|uniref:LacI family DNA-binding transcriptional regulator n=1 Tax=Actinoplanes sp. CA-030573 TaxID=3239898 RepID=UPI003D92E84D